MVVFLINRVVLLANTIYDVKKERRRAMGYGLDDQGLRVQFLVGERDFSLLHNIQSGSGAHTTSYTIGARGCIPRGKAV
jgi:hypothetical protein